MTAPVPAACARCETALEVGDLRCAICALPVPSGGMLDAEAEPRAQVLRCHACGAAIGFSAQAQAPRCGFCGQDMALERPIDPIETARLVLPFTVDRRTAEAAVRGWLRRRGWLAPRALSSEAMIESLTPLSWAAWQVCADARVAWTADSDAGALRSAWAPHAGETELAFRDIVIPASRGLGQGECRRLIPFYDLASAATIEHAPAGGGPAQAIESFDTQRSAARAQVSRAVESMARVRVERHIPGRRFRKVRVACLIERQTTERVALPAWVLAYRYRGALYRAIVHGQRGEVVFGTSPIDWTKLAGLAVVAALLAVIVTVFVMR
jgi:hypothetical protein